MSSKLLQIKVEPLLKEKVKRIALAKGLNITSYIKMVVIEASEREDQRALTENGFMAGEEKRLAESVKEGRKFIKEGKLKSYKSMKEALRSLEE